MALAELEVFQGPQFLGFVRNVPPPAAYKAALWLPDKTVFDLEVEYIVGAQDRPVMASIISWDAEAPLGGRPGLGHTIRQELPPIKRKVKIPEKELIRFLTPRANTPDKQTSIDFVFNDTVRLIRGIQARVEWMRMQALSEDTLAYDEEGITVTIDYGVTADQQYSMDGGDFSTWWSDVANADWVADMQFICDDIEDRTGFRPKRFVCAKQIVRYMMQNAAAKELLYPTPPGRELTMEEVNSLLNLYDLPPIETYDVDVYRENADGSVTTLNPLDPKKAVFLPENGAETFLGNTLWGPTAESRALIGTPRASQAPGIYAVVYGQEDPPSEWIKAAAVSVPSMPGANLIGQAQLLAP